MEQVSQNTPGNLTSVPFVVLQELAENGSSLAEAAHALLPSRGVSCKSSLTVSGAPIEVGLVWPANELRLTIDPCPQSTAGERVRLCYGEVAGTLSRRQQDIFDTVIDWQSSHAPYFGAWLGLRMQGRKIKKKLYLDIPDGSPWNELENEIVAGRPVLASRNIRATMVGLDPNRPGFELYYRNDTLRGDEVNTLLRRFLLPQHGGEVTKFLQDLTQRTIRFALPSHDMGFSVAINNCDEPFALTWYTTSEASIGPANRARQAILRVGRERGWQLDVYKTLLKSDDRVDSAAHGLKIGRASCRERV